MLPRVGTFDVALWLLSLEPDWRDPNLARRDVTAREHALQAATRAFRADACDDEIVGALLHDSARPLSDEFHGEVISQILRGVVSDDVVAALWHHGAFQADLLHGTDTATGWAAESWYSVARRLAAWDSASFDPAYDTLPLPTFIAILERTLRT